MEFPNKPVVTAEAKVRLCLYSNISIHMVVTEFHTEVSGVR